MGTAYLHVTRSRGRGGGKKEKKGGKEVRLGMPLVFSGVPARHRVRKRKKSVKDTPPECVKPFLNVIEGGGEGRGMKKNPYHRFHSARDLSFLGR